MHHKILYTVCILFFMGYTLNANTQVTERDVLIAIDKGVESTKKFLKTTATYQLYEKNILAYRALFDDFYKHFGSNKLLK